MPTGTGLPASSESQPQGAQGVPCHRASCSDPRRTAMCPATGLASLLTMGMSMAEEFVGPSWSGLSCCISRELGPTHLPTSASPSVLPPSPPTGSFGGLPLTWLAFSRFVMIRPTSSALDTKERGPETGCQPPLYLSVGHGGCAPHSPPETKTGRVEKNPDCWEPGTVPQNSS